MSDDLLFTTAEPRRRTLSMFAACDSCGLFRGCDSPKMPVTGEGRRRILIISDYPGKHEDRQNKQMAGPAGDHLSDTLRKYSVNMRRDCWLYNAINCYSEHPSNHKTAVFDCRPNVFKVIRDLNPVTIILAGGQAIKSVIGHLWKEGVGPVSRWAGWRIPCREPNAWLCPTYNPAHLLYEDTDPVEKIEFVRHIERAVELTDRPWNEIPNYESKCSVVYDPLEAAAKIDQITSGTIAYDFETTCLKPDRPTSQIACCSICYEGEYSFAFPWQGAVLPAMRRLVTDRNIRKIASNLDIEDRWTRKHLGVEVSGWWRDCMLTAHTLAPRGKEEDRKSDDGISGLKFQAFARLGQPDYDSHIEPFLVSGEKGGYALNRVFECDFYALGLYCAMDSILEYDVVMDQQKELGRL